MNSKEKYYRRLVDGYLNKSLTKQELTVFFDLLSKGELDFYLEEDMVANFPQDHSNTTQKTKRGMWAIAVVLAVIFLSVSMYFSMQLNLGDEAQQVNVESPVQPGRDYAVLTLSDGKQIILDEASSSEELHDGNIAVANLSGSSVNYDLSTLGLQHMSQSDLEDKYHALETPRGGTYQIVLPDGSTAWLNSLSKIKFPLSFRNDQRMVEIEGEVFFDVLSDIDRPFVVKSRGQEILVTGTSFNVNAYSDEPFIRTTLISGSIIVTSLGESIKVNAGGEVLNSGTGLYVQPGDLEQAVAWKEGYFRFDKVDVPTLMRQVSRWYNVNVKFIGNVSSERFAGKIKRSENINELIKIFSRGGMNISLQGRTVVVEN